MDERLQRLVSGLTQEMQLVEIGPSHSPAIPKSKGWKTTIVDHADAEALRKNYSRERIDLIEDVDVVWRGGPLHEAFPADRLGRYDAVVSSHSFEHMPDPVRFLQSCEALTGKQGSIRFALPDKRCCFDFFSPLSTTGDMLAAFNKRPRVHDKRTSFNEVAYAVTNAGKNGWVLGASLPNLGFVHSLGLAKGVFNRASDGDRGDYYDFHAWRFTPSSFALIMLELASLGFISLTVTKISETIGHEFFAWLDKGFKPLPEPELQEERMKLLKQTVAEMSRQIAMIPDLPV